MAESRGGGAGGRSRKPSPKRGPSNQKPSSNTPTPRRTSSSAASRPAGPSVRPSAKQMVAISRAGRPGGVSLADVRLPNVAKGVGDIASGAGRGISDAFSNFAPQDMLFKFLSKAIDDPAGFVKGKK